MLLCIFLLYFPNVSKLSRDGDLKGCHLTSRRSSSNSLTRIGKKIYICSFFSLFCICDDKNVLVTTSKVFYLLSCMRSVGHKRRERIELLMQTGFLQHRRMKSRLSVEIDCRRRKNVSLAVTLILLFL
uniref:Secreted protein n=1 Tax=Rhipicephalus microplus TaxID=6941 RepID=A0A6G5A0W6_RHIMP